MKRTKNGFTLIETLVSLLIISYSIIFFLNTILFSMQETGRSSVRFKVFQKIDFEKNRLLSIIFESPELTEGYSQKKENNMIISKQIVNRGPELKKIYIEVQYKNFISKIVFFRSKIIKEVKK
ncbi:MAG: prepilin-type N-terminal cleavage/methylation domain-containing protein [Acidobacteriota bacterium]